MSGGPFERVPRLTLTEQLEAETAKMNGVEKGRAEQGRRISYLTIAASAMRNHLGDWLKRPAASIAPAEAVRRLDKVRDTAGPTAANRLLSYARAAYSWAIKRQLLLANPFAGLEAPRSTRARDRVLTAEELAAIWRAADTLAPGFSRFLRVLLLTMSRREEVAGMRWSELTADTWTLPAERSKNGKAHIVHLSPPVREILAAQPRIAGCPFVFPGAGLRGPLSGFSYAKRGVDAAIAATQAEAGREPAGLPHWTLHDFRRSGVTAIANMGFPPHVADKLLNHTTGAIQGVAAVYQRAEFLAERKAALDAWAAYVLAAVEGRPQPENVVPLRPMEGTNAAA